MLRKTPRTGTPCIERPSTPITLLGQEPLGWACLLALTLGGFYGAMPNIGLLLPVGVLLSALFATKDKLLLRAVDWAVLALALLDVPSVVFSQYRANSSGASAIILTSALVYLAVRLTIQTAAQVAAFCGILGLSEAALSIFGLGQFHANETALADAGLTDLVAFRSRLILPPANWVLGEWFTLLLLTLPFSCAPSAYFWRSGKRWFAAISLCAPLLIAAALTLSCWHAVFGSMVVFCAAVCAAMMLSRIISVRTAGGGRFAGADLQAETSTS